MSRDNLDFLVRVKDQIKEPEVVTVGITLLWSLGGRVRGVECYCEDSGKLSKMPSDDCAADFLVN